MKKIKIILLTPLLAMLVSCDAFVKTIHVTGQVIDATTCKPIKNARVLIADLSSTGSGFSTQNGNEVFTDATGIYQLEINNTSGSNFQLFATANDYYETKRDEHKIPTDKNVYNYTIHLQPYGYVNFVLNKSDNTCVSTQVNYEGEFGRYGTTLQEGVNTTDSVILRMKGNQNNQLQFYVKKTYSNLTSYDVLQEFSLYAVANDTVTYIANF